MPPRALKRGVASVERLWTRKISGYCLTEATQCKMGGVHSVRMKYKAVCTPPDFISEQTTEPPRGKYIGLGRPEGPRSGARFWALGRPS